MVRRKSVFMIEDLSVAKGYKLETLLLAVSLMDRYIAQKLREKH